MTLMWPTELSGVRSKVKQGTPIPLTPWQMGTFLRKKEENKERCVSKAAGAGLGPRPLSLLWNGSAALGSVHKSMHPRKAKENVLLCVHRGLHFKSCWFPEENRRAIVQAWMILLQSKEARVHSFPTGSQSVVSSPCPVCSPRSPIGLGFRSAVARVPPNACSRAHSSPSCEPEGFKGWL